MSSSNIAHSMELTEKHFMKVLDHLQQIVASDKMARKHLAATLENFKRWMHQAQSAAQAHTMQAGEHLAKELSADVQQTQEEEKLTRYQRDLLEKLEKLESAQIKDIEDQIDHIKKVAHLCDNKDLPKMPAERQRLITAAQNILEEDTYIRQAYASISKTVEELRQADVALRQYLEQHRGALANQKREYEALKAKGGDSKVEDALEDIGQLMRTLSLRQTEMEKAIDALLTISEQLTDYEGQVSMRLQRAQKDFGTGLIKETKDEFLQILAAKANEKDLLKKLKTVTVDAKKKTIREEKTELDVERKEKLLQADMAKRRADFSKSP